MLTLANVGSLPATLTADETAELWGCSTWTLYAMAKAGTCPVAPLHLGRKLRWPTAPVLRSVGIDVAPERKVRPSAADLDSRPALLLKEDGRGPS